MTRIIRLALLLAVCSVPSWAVFECSGTALGNGWTGATCQENAGFAGSQTIDHTNAAGQFVFGFCIGDASTGTVVISDNFNTFTAVESNFADATAGTMVSSAYFYNASDTGTHTATCTASVGATVVFTLLQITGSATSSLLDGHNITAVSSPTGSNNLTTANSNDLIIVYGSDNNGPAYTQGTGYTLLSQESWNGAQAKSVTGTGTYSGAFGGQATDRYTVGIVAVKSITVSSNSKTPAHGGVF